MNLPRELLDKVIRTCAGDKLIEVLIKEETDEDLEHSTYHLDGIYVVGFRGFTKSSILLLLPDSTGDYLARFDRNPPVGS